MMISDSEVGAVEFVEKVSLLEMWNSDEVLNTSGLSELNTRSWAHVSESSLGRLRLMDSIIDITARWLVFGCGDRSIDGCLPMESDLEMGYAYGDAGWLACLLACPCSMYGAARRASMRCCCWPLRSGGCDRSDAMSTYSSVFSEKHKMHFCQQYNQYNTITSLLTCVGAAFQSFFVYLSLISSLLSPSTLSA